MLSSSRPKLKSVLGHGEVLEKFHLNISCLHPLNDAFFNKGTVEIPKFDFAVKFEEFAFHTFLTRPEAIVANRMAQFECLEARQRLLLHMPITKPVRIEEFEQTQIQTIQQSSSFLKVSINIAEARG